MRERNGGSAKRSEFESKAEQIYIMREIYHSDPNHRCFAAMEGFGLDILKDDEVWLVRHVAKRMLRRQELEEEGVVLSTLDMKCADVHIDDMVYELYKVDWLNKNTTPETRMQSIRDWCNHALRDQERDMWPYTYDYWLELKGYPVKDGQSPGLYDNFYIFLGCMKPGYKGVYHDREYVAELLGYDEKLLALYDADINDDKELNCQAPSIEERLTDASGRSGRAKNKGTSKDEFTLA